MCLRVSSQGIRRAGKNGDGDNESNPRKQDPYSVDVASKPPVFGGEDVVGRVGRWVDV